MYVIKTETESKEIVLSWRFCLNSSFISICAVLLIKKEHCTWKKPLIKHSVPRGHRRKKLSGNKAFGVKRVSLPTKIFFNVFSNFNQIYSICMLWHLNANLESPLTRTNSQKHFFFNRQLFAANQMICDSCDHFKFSFTFIKKWEIFFACIEKYFCRDNYLYINPLMHLIVLNLQIRSFAELFFCPQQEICNPLTMGCEINHKGSKKI